METGKQRTDNIRGREMNGWLALSPLAVFLVVYLVSSILANDFYSIPIASAFLISFLTSDTYSFSGNSMS